MWTIIQVSQAMKPWSLSDLMLRNRVSAPNGHKIALIDIPERSRRQALAKSHNVSGGVPALLNRDRGHPRQWPARPIHRGSNVPDGEDLRKAWDAEIGPYDYPSVRIKRDSKRSGQWRWRHAGSPDYRRCIDGLITSGNSTRVNQSDGCSFEDFDAEAAQRFFSPHGEGIRKSGQQAGSSFDQDNASISRLNRAKISRHDTPRQFSQGPSQLDSGRPATDDDEG